jgi:electron transfer flavoprotein beta subunit
VEAALKIKDEKGTRVTVITMGPPHASESLRDTLGLGADDAVLLSDRAFAGSDTWATSTALAAAIRKMGDVDVVLCGKQAVDGDTAQIGPEMATLLDIPYATFVKKIEMPQSGFLKAIRQTDEGTEIWKLPLPALLTVIKEIGEPRMPSLRHKMRAKKAEIPVWGAADLGLDPEFTGLCGSFTQVVRVFSPPRRSNRIQLQGSVEDQAEQLFQHLKNAKVPGL